MILTGVDLFKNNLARLLKRIDLTRRVYKKHCIT